MPTSWPKTSSAPWCASRAPTRTGDRARSANSTSARTTGPSRRARAASSACWKKAGHTEPRKRRPASAGGRLSRGIKAQAPNDIWSVDFKGWWHDNSGRRIEPLTVRDEHSRMILELRAVPDARTATVRTSFEHLFEKHGLPAAIRSDNGPPFASVQGLLGLSRLSAWWLALGIDLERSRPGCPQDNGAYERMHLDVRRELQAGRLGRSQQSFDTWRHELNTQRPHEALNMATPAEIYTPSVRTYAGTPEALDYQGKETRRVHEKGYISFANQYVQLSKALAGWDIALGEQHEEGIELWFANLLLGHLHTGTLSFQPITPGATGPLAASAPLQRPEGRSTPVSAALPKNPNPTLTHKL